MTIRLSTLARQDLDDIRQYTLETWGQAQWHKYYRGLVIAFERIADSPTIGRDRSLLVEGLRSLTYEKHILFFKPVAAINGEPVILRIVHERRNLPALTYYDDLDAV